jgi:hypothetical protein
MTETKKEAAAPESNMTTSESETTLNRSRQLSNGRLPSFDSPAQLDNWFDAQLVQIYSEVVSEPLPKEFLDLLEKLREKSKGTN